MAEQVRDEAEGTPSRLDVSIGGGGELPEFVGRQEEHVTPKAQAGQLLLALLRAEQVVARAAGVIWAGKSR